MELIPDQMDWTRPPLTVVMAAAADGVPEALAELERRLT